MDMCCTDRRKFLIGGVSVLGGLALAPRGARGQSLGPKGKLAPTLVIIELSGGNDGLNTIVPFTEKRYYDARPRTALAHKDLLPLADARGLHPNLVSVQQLYKDKRLAIIEGAGYPRPNRSHFTSQDIWYTGRATGKASGDGWAGRLVADLYPDDRSVTHAIHVGSTTPYTLHSSTHPIVYLDLPPAYRWAQNGPSIAASARKSGDEGMKDAKGMGERDVDALERIRSITRSADSSSTEIRRAVARYKPRRPYPDVLLGQDLRTAAAILQAGIGARVLSVTQTGYDTHDDQPARHWTLLRELDAALGTFVEDIQGTPAGERTVILVFSEFGRRVEDNASQGTDHGTAAPMFLIGTSVKGGLYGQHPSLEDLDDGDLKFTTDFRSVYATVVRNWFGMDSTRILGAEYPTLPLFS